MKGSFFIKPTAPSKEWPFSQAAPADVPTLIVGQVAATKSVFDFAAANQWSTPPGQITTVVTSDATPAIKELSVNIQALRHDIQELTKAIHASMPSAGKVIVYRDISKETATEEISKLLESAGEMYPSDISSTLRIDYDLVSEVLRELRQQRKVEV